MILADVLFLQCTAVSVKVEPCPDDIHSLSSLGEDGEELLMPVLSQ
jgi:hypothetical protein